VCVVREFLDVVHEAIQLPLRIDLRAVAQCEAIKALVHAQIREDGLDQVLGADQPTYRVTEWLDQSLGSRHTSE
jgi:hypothetical protein